MIIEFNGLPGTGKTTVASELKEILEQNGISSMFKYHRREGRIKRYASYLFDGSYQLRRLARKYATSIEGGDLAEHLKTADILVYYYRMYRLFEKYCSDQVLLIDQGVLQGLISISHTDPIGSGKEIAQILKFFVKKKIVFDIVNCKNDVALSFERIRLRNTTGGRLDRCGDDVLGEHLAVQKSNFEIVRSVVAENTLYEQVEIDTAALPQQNALKVFHTFFEGNR